MFWSALSGWSLCGEESSSSGSDSSHMVSSGTVWPAHSIQYPGVGSRLCGYPEQNSSVPGIRYFFFL
ncbi:hypothetical protein E2C01_073941 [Portunus trituberculatus]|uniref:Uncharacterized protein n=1 Tax=Portunus trituberculatus TaxID=210409 RepID=A0A5B7IAU4_PORTR|nr:hypothetical protein [Portunus trituberculatus]